MEATVNDVYYCSRCGRRRLSDEQFCPKCGLAFGVVSSGQRKHGGCLTAFLLFWVVIGVVALLAPPRGSLVDWQSLDRYGGLPVVPYWVYHATVSVCMVGFPLAIWLWWKKWCVICCVAVCVVDLAVVCLGRAFLGPPLNLGQSLANNFELALVLSWTALALFGELVRREWQLLE
jgi:hypothetical protein